MNAEESLNLARRFIELPLEKRRLFFHGLHEEGVDFSLFPIPTNVDVPDRHALSYSQRRMWFLWQLDPQSGAYNLPCAVRLAGPLNKVALSQAFEFLIERHETLRTVFRLEADGDVEWVASSQPLAIEFEDLQSLSESQRECRIRQQAEQQSLLPFDLNSGPLLRVKLLCLEENHHVLLLTLHHIVADGWSMNVLIHEFSAIYANCSRGEIPQLQPLSICYSDYALWQRRWLEAGEAERQLNYWRAQLGGEQPVLELPSDRSRPALASLEGQRYEFAIAPDLTQRLRQLAKQYNVTLFTLLLASFQTLLHRYSGQRDIRIGAPIANRNREETENLIGLFVNTQVLKADIDNRKRFVDLLQQVRQTVLDAQAHQDLPFEQLVEALQPDRSLNLSPLFQVMYSHQSQVADIDSVKSDSGLTLSLVEWENRTAQYDLSLDTYEKGEALYAVWTYAIDLFEATTAARISQHWINLLSAIVADAAQIVGDLPLLSSAEYALQIDNHNRTETAYPLDQGIAQLFETQVSLHANRIAASCLDETWSYRELDERANRVAHALIVAGVKPDQPVALLSDRGLEWLAMVLGIFKAGGAYLPLDPSLPEKRLLNLIALGSPPVLLANDARREQAVTLLAELPAAARPAIQVWGEIQASVHSIKSPAIQTSARHLAYVIYTSGSTGAPKGVMVEQAGMLNNQLSKIPYLQLTERDVIAQTASQSFDISVWQLLTALLCGARVDIVPNAIAHDPSALLRHVDTCGITVLQSVPSLIQALLDEPVAGLDKLRWMLPTGEALLPDIARRWQSRYPKIELINAYGPAECSDDVALFRLAEINVDEVRLPIGTATDNNRLYVLDSGLQPVPAGVTGELYVGGTGVGRGYLGDPVRTALAFVPDLYAAESGARLYRTGDLAKYRADGVIEYVGRVDHQVKLRGFRIELGEIEARLAEQAMVSEAAAVVQTGAHEQHLIAYVVLADKNEIRADSEIRESYLRDIQFALTQQLPEYMVPSHLMILEQLPLTPNGKLDRKALPQIDLGRLQRQYEAPRTTLEQELADIWSSVLKIERVGLTDNFFELGGHSLLAAQVIARVRKILNIEVALRGLFEAPQLGAFARKVEQIEGGNRTPVFTKANRNEPLALSYAQQRQWFLWQLDPSSSAYHMATALCLTGALNVEALHRSFDDLIDRHEILRTTFRQQGEYAEQLIHTLMACDFYVDALPEKNLTTDAIKNYFLREMQLPFDLERGPLLRVRLLRIDDQNHALGLTLHHIIGDGWSTPIIVDELLELYAAHSQQRRSDLPAIVFQYADYAAWQRQWMNSGELQRQLGYWTALLSGTGEQLGGEQPALELPSDRARPAVQSFSGARLDIEIDNDLARALKRLARQHDVTLFVLLLASFQTLLHRYSGQSNIRIGVPIANRHRIEVERLIGFFVNTLVIKAQIDGQLSVAALLQQIRNTVLEAQMHQDLPFEQLVDALQPDRSLSRTPLFQVMFNHEVTDRQGALARELQGLKFENLDWESSTTQFDLVLDTFEKNRSESNEGETDNNDVEIWASLSYATDLFDATTIERLAQHWKNLLRAFVADASLSIGALPLLSDEEQHSIRRDWDHTAQHYPTDRFVHQLVSDRAASAPDALAVIFGEERLTYSQLDKRANRLAHRLIEQGVGPEVRVGIVMPRSADIMVAFLAVLKAGGAYVPLDPEYPLDRLRYMLADSGAALLLTHSELLARLPLLADNNCLVMDKLDDGKKYPDTPPQIDLVEENLAYVIYTSGSTGLPKGVAVSHGPLAMHCLATGERYEMSAADCELHFMSFAFDGSHEGWMHPLIYGASLLIRDDNVWTPEQTYEEMHRHRVTVGVFPPIYLQQLAEHAERDGNPPPVRVYCFGGDAVPNASYELAWRVLRPHYIFNGYGPTETVVTPLIWKASRNDKCAAAYAPIGHLVGNRSGYIMDADLNLLPTGLAGELYLGGLGVARGYLNRPSLTAQRFVPDPFAHGARLYRSGDLTRYRPDGVVEYIGRIDHQVKIRGFRIELGEIEARLQDQDTVREAVVVAHEAPSGKQLIAYLVPAQLSVLNDGVALSELRNALKINLRETLPDYMVPAHLIFLEQLPLTPNGKLDRKGLPAPEPTHWQTAYENPQGAMEQKLAALWADVLKLERVGRTDNFFELGGDSIISLQVVSRARQLGIHITAKQLFQHQTVQALSAVAEFANNKINFSQEPVHGSMPLLPIQRWFFETKIPERHHWNQSILLVARDAFDVPSLLQALHALIQHHDALRLRFTELNGHCVTDINGQWTASFDDSAENVDVLWTRVLNTNSELSAVCDEAQRSLNLHSGPLLRAVLIELPQGEQRLLIVVHHLVVDGVSWRILLEDFQIAYRQAISKQAIALPPKTTSFKAWAEQLDVYASGEKLSQELVFWQQQMRNAPIDLPCAIDLSDDNRDDHLPAHAETVYSRLNQSHTQQLLQAAPAAYRTQINELLLTALTRVIARWTSSASVLIQLEGHGREDIFEAVDLSRTVGWFTTVFPVQLYAAGDIGTAIKTIKEQLRVIPQRGIGFGILRYCSDSSIREILSSQPTPRITFNYLGQFDNSFDTEKPAFYLSDEARGDEQSSAAPLENWLSLNGQVVGGILSIGWTFNRALFDTTTMQQLADEYTSELEILIEHCCAANNFGVTPADFPLLDITQERLDALPTPACDIEDMYPLSPMQQGMLFHTLHDNTGDYINQLRVDIDGLDVERFRQAWQNALDAHAVLRSSFIWQFETPLQLVHKKKSIALAEYDWRDREPLQINLDELADSDRRLGFDLTQAPLLRLSIIRTQTNRHHLIYTNHHILMDGWSNSQLMGEVLQRYAGQTVVSTSHYRDYIAWLQQQNTARAEAFWRQQLQSLDAPSRLADAIGNSQPHALETEGHGDYWQTLSVDRAQRISAFARQHKVTVNTIVQAVWALLLQRYTAQATVAFGATVSGRPSELSGIEQQIGLFINTLPVIATPRPDTKVDEWLRIMQAQNIALREYEHTPLYDIQRWAGMKGEALFDSILVFENFPVAEALKQSAPAGLHFGEVRSHEQTNYPLTLTIGMEATLSVHYNFDGRYFDASAIAQLAGHFSNLLEALMRDPTASIATLSMVDDVEYSKSLTEWNRTAMNYPRDENIHIAIERQAEQTPESVAVVFANQQLNYRELNRRANRLAYRLIALGVGPEILVGVAIERSLDLVISLLAILKAGGAYVPIDVSYPENRLRHVLQDSGINVLLTHSPLRDALPESTSAQVICVDHLFNDQLVFNDQLAIQEIDAENPRVSTHPENRAYVIYTSGSTGLPKGVVIRHRALTNHMHWMQRTLALQTDDKVLQKTAFGFDASVWEFWLPLMAGAQLVLAPPTLSEELTSFWEIVASNGITTLQLVPALLQAILPTATAAQLASLRRLLLGGEVVNARLLEQLSQLWSGPVYNLYGPTETTIDATCWPCADDGSDIPIGRPIANITAYLLDDYLNPAAPLTGEIYLGGEGLARNYHHRPALTAERFIPHPFSMQGERVYRTGDRARHREDGVIIYAGRNDHQIKVRGFRIELGEIESQLVAYPGIREAVVIAEAVLIVETGSVAQTDSNEARLIAYIVGGQTADVDIEALKQQLAKSLPDYMVPSAFVFLPQLPLTPNGKLDRAALPAPDEIASREYEAPQTELQQQVATIWCEVLKIDRIGLNDHFFELGGHSLLAVGVVSRLQLQLGIKATTQTIFQFPVLKGFVARLSASDTRLNPQKLDELSALLDEMEEA